MAFLWLILCYILFYILILLSTATLIALAGYIGLCIFYAIAPIARSVAHFANKHPIHFTRSNHPDSGLKPRAVDDKSSNLLGRLVVRSITHAYREVKPQVRQFHLPTLDIVIICLVFLLAAFTGLMVYLGRRRARDESIFRSFPRRHKATSFLPQDSTLDDSERGLNAPGSITPRLGHLTKEDVDADTDAFSKTSLLADGAPSFFSRSERDLLAGVQEYGYRGR